jgi:hypothetical protein
VWGNESPHSQASSHFGSWSPNGLSNLHWAISGVKTHYIDNFFIPLERSWNIDINNGLTQPIWILKHKLWAKEGLVVKLIVWLLTIKSQASPWFPCVKMACHILLKTFWWGLQLFFKPHLNQRSSKEVMGFQSCKSHNFENFRIPTWESWDKMSFGCMPHGQE